MVIRSSLKNISKTLLDSGIVAGPTGDVNGFTCTGFSLAVHVAGGGGGESGVGLDGDGCLVKCEKMKLRLMYSVLMTKEGEIVVIV